MLDAAYAAEVGYVDAARSYGRAEEFLGAWLAARGHPHVVVGSKWGYRYTGGWRLDASHQEVKEHSLAMFTAQLAESRSALGDRIALYQVHSLTLDSPLFSDAPLLAALANPWATVVLSGAVTRRQLGANLAALTVGELPGLSLAEPSAGYWAARAARPWQ